MSLRNRLLLILGGTFIVLWGLAALWLLGDLRREVTVALDERLASFCAHGGWPLRAITATIGHA